MATVVGSIADYTPDENWQQYLEWLQFFLEVNGVTNASKKRATFLSVVEPMTFQLLRSLIAPANPSDKTFEELTEVLKTHFNPEPSEIVERYKFHTRIRRLGESIATYRSYERCLSVAISARCLTMCFGTDSYAKSTMTRCRRGSYRSPS